MIIYKTNLEFCSKSNEKGIDLSLMQAILNQASDIMNNYSTLYSISFNANNKYMFLIMDDVSLYNKNISTLYDKNIKFRDAYDDTCKFIEKTILFIQDQINGYVLKCTDNHIFLSLDKDAVIIPYNIFYENEYFRSCPVYRSKSGKGVNKCELINKEYLYAKSTKELILEMESISNNCADPIKRICDRKNSKKYHWQSYVYIIEANIDNFNTLAMDLGLLLQLNNKSLGLSIYKWICGNNRNGFDPYLGNTIIIESGIWSNDNAEKLDQNSIRPCDIYGSLLYNETHTNVIIRSDSAKFTEGITNTFNEYGVNCIVIKQNKFTLRQVKSYIRKMVSGIPNNNDEMLKSAMKTIISDESEYYQEELYEHFKLWRRNYETELALPAYKGYFNNKKEDEIIKNSLDDLNELIGLKNIKDQINKIICTVKMEEMIKNKFGGDIDINPYNMVFTGNPGTGKTIVGKMIANIFYENKIIKSPNFVYAGREDLVGKYIGWTAANVKEKFKTAKGGVLFIDEAYSLVDDNFGKEAINTLVKFMDNNKDTVVIFAGYPKEIKNFISCNPGMESRIKYFIDFPDYSIDELIDILKLKLSKRNLKATDKAIDAAKEKIKSAMVDEKFGNGRFVRNLLEKAIENHAVSISKLKKITDDKLVTLQAKDFESVDISKIKINSRSIGF